MSYRTVKRVLGETHLERKCLILFGGSLLILIAISFWIYGNRTTELVYQQNRTKGRLLVNTILTQEHWKALEVQKGKVLADAFGKDIKNEDYRWTHIRPNATGKHRFEDAFDYQVLQHFLKKPGPPAEGEVEFQERRMPEDNAYVYYQAVRATRNCVTCHRALFGQPNLMDGDLLSVMKIHISDKPVQAEIQWNNALLWATAIITAFLLVVASYLIIRYVIVKPLKHLQDVSDAIGHGDMDKRAEIRTGDEFEALGTAFNRMVRHLIAAQEELRQVNSDLDSKVDELAQRNMQLYEMNRLKSDFLATVSHELRTPLNSIIGFSDVLRSIDSLEDKQKRYVLNIQKSGRMLLEMINDILDLAKIESGKMEVRLSDFRIDQIVHAQCDMARPLTEKKNIDLEVDLPPGIPPLRQDQGKVQQILNNLLSNAIKFTPEGGRITVSAFCDEDDFLNLVVGDTGVGIAEEDRTRIFEKFRQGEAVMSGDATTREYSGTGLGLSIVKELCKLLGGEVLLESELGKGSSFTVRLPRESPDRPEPEPYLPRPLIENLAGARRAEHVERVAPAAET